MYRKIKIVLDAIVIYPDCGKSNFFNPNIKE